MTSSLSSNVLRAGDKSRLAVHILKEGELASDMPTYFGARLLRWLNARDLW